MAVTIPASDIQSTALNNAITKITAEIASNTNTTMVAWFTRAKANAQYALVNHLIGAGLLSCASILANETYTKGAPDGV